jgi:hypothetical protein
MPESELTRIIRAGFEKLCLDFTDHVERLGFRRTRKTFWTRPHALTVDVLHIHRSGRSYGAPFSNASVSVRIHFAIRVWNDDFKAVGLNGPSTDQFLGHRQGYHLTFNARSFSQYDRCFADATRVLEEEALPWFTAFSSPEVLLDRPDSPLSPDSQTRLRAAILSGADPATVAASQKLLGIRPSEQATSSV